MVKKAGVRKKRGMGSQEAMHARTGMHGIPKNKHRAKGMRKKKRG